MHTLRLYSCYDSKAQTFLQPFWADHKANALRSFQKIVNEKNDPNNLLAQHPEDFCLFELASIDLSTGVISTHAQPIFLGLGVEFIKQAA